MRTFHYTEIYLSSDPMQMRRNFRQSISPFRIQFPRRLSIHTVMDLEVPSEASIQPLFVICGPIIFPGILPWACGEILILLTMCYSIGGTVRWMVGGISRCTILSITNTCWDI